MKELWMECVRWTNLLRAVRRRPCSSLETACPLILVALLSVFAAPHSVSAADPAAGRQTAVGRWRTLVTEGTVHQRHECGYIKCADKIYLIGGRGNRPVNVFDPTTQVWTTAAPAPIELHHFQPVVFKERIYVLGALTGPYPNETPVPHIWIYDPLDDTWTKGPPIPEQRRRGGCGVVAYDGKIFMVCGIRDGHRGDHKQWLDEFDPVTGQWRILPDAPRARDHFQAVAIGDKLYAAGGRNTSQRTNQVFELTIKEVDVYDFTAGKWSTLPSPEQDIPTPRAGTAAIEFGGELVIIGGESGQPEAHNEVEAFDPQTGSWRKLAQLEQGRHGTGAGVFGDRIFVSAGSGNRGGGPELNTTECYLRTPADDD